MKPLLTVLAVFLLTGCTSPESATKTLQNQGMTDIQITGYRWLACSEDDTYKTGFTATSISGAEVSGAVCAGWFGKGATVRFD